jgi:hypothetical protein
MQQIATTDLNDLFFIFMTINHAFQRKRVIHNPFACGNDAAMTHARVSPGAGLIFYINNISRNLYLKKITHVALESTGKSGCRTL